MHDEVGIVTKVTKGFCQQAKVAMPKELVSADGEVGVEEDFQKSYKMPKRTKRRRVLRFRTRGFVDQERRCKDRRYKVGKNKQR